MGFAENLEQASFRGVPFLVSTESVNRGKKTVMHEYPNSDVRYVEELGKLPPTFSLTAIVHGADAINQRLRLENALERSGLGLLVHPVYGRLNVTALTFTVSGAQQELGQFTFDIQFARSRANITPSPAAPTNTTVSNAADAARAQADAALEKIYTPASNPNVFTSFVNTLQGVLDTVNGEIKSVVDLTTSGAATFDRVYRSITANIAQVVYSAQELRENITLFYAAALNAPEFVEQLSAAWDNLLEYPLTVATTSALTIDQQQENQNNTAITEHLKLTALASSYEAKAYKSFTTDTQLNAARQKLNNKYKNSLKRQNEQIAAVGLQPLANEQGVRDEFASLRGNTRAVFDEKEKAIFRIVNIDPGISSMALTAYRYYGDLELLEEIIGLNEDINVANFSGQIKALTS